MTTTLSTKGQVVLPQPVRKKLGLHPGVRLACLVRDGEIILKPQTKRTAKARLATSKVTGLPVIVPPRGTLPLTPEAVALALADFP